MHLQAVYPVEVDALGYLHFYFSQRVRGIESDPHIAGERQVVFLPGGKIDVNATGVFQKRSVAQVKFVNIGSVIGQRTHKIHRHQVDGIFIKIDFPVQVFHHYRNAVIVDVTGQSGAFFSPHILAIGGRRPAVVHVGNGFPQVKWQTHLAGYLVGVDVVENELRFFEKEVFAEFAVDVVQRKLYFIIPFQAVIIEAFLAVPLFMGKYFTNEVDGSIVFVAIFFGFADDFDFLDGDAVL